MKNGFEKALILSLSIGIVLLTIAGCQEQTTMTQKASIKVADKVAIKTETRTVETKAKAAITEIVELQKELAAKDKEIAKLQAEISQCQEERDTLKKAQEKSLDEMGEEAMNTFDENMQLRIKIEELQKQMEELKAGSKPN